MSNKNVIVLALVLLSLVLVLSLPATAQMRQHNRGLGAQGNMVHPNIDPANKVTLDGTVESINMGPGQGFPSFTLVLSDGKRVTVVASPYRALLSANFKIAIGDHMLVLGFPSLQYQDTYLAAELKNLTNGTTITLRDASGTPVVGQGGPGQCGVCPFGPRP